MVFDLENDPQERLNLAAKVGADLRRLSEMISSYA